MALLLTVVGDLLILIHNHGLAIGVAVAHICFFLYLDKKVVSTTVSQTIVSIISVALVRLYSVLLTTTLSTALVQIVWRRFRLQAMPLATVDSLFRLCIHFLSRTLPYVVVNAPAFAAIGICIACVPIAMVFPPSALTVDYLPVPGMLTIQAPSFNPGLRQQGNSTAEEKWAQTVTVTHLNSATVPVGLPDIHGGGMWYVTDCPCFVVREAEVEQVSV